MNTLILLPVPHQTCAHLYELRQRVSQPSETRDPIGRCYVLSEDLTERDDLDGGEWKFCEGRPQGHEQFGFCQQGLSVSFTPDNNFILFGAPGTYNWKGKVSDWAAEGWIRKTTLHVERFLIGMFKMFIFLEFKDGVYYWVLWLFTVDMKKC